jgi:hypothetical protein
MHKSAAPFEGPRAAALSIRCATSASVADRFRFSAREICAASIFGIVLAIGFLMQRLVSILIGRVDLPGGFKYAPVQSMVRIASPGGAVRNLQGGRWTKDWCGGDQQWRPRLSGRGWTDRRRSG